MDTLDDFESNNPDDIIQEAAEASAQLLPQRSKSRYETEYSQFCDWREKRKVKIVNDDVVLVYLSEKAKSMKSSTLWSKFSMLKSCLAVKENMDLSK